MRWLGASTLMSSVLALRVLALALARALARTLTAMRDADMKLTPGQSRFLALVLALSLARPAATEPLTLSQAPAGGRSAPAPIVIVSVDTRGRNGGNVMPALRAVLIEASDASALPDGTVRLGWQDLSGCRLPSATTSSTGTGTVAGSGNRHCGGRNAPRTLDPAHRADFQRWAGQLQANANASASPQQLLQDAGAYLRRTDLGAANPWAAAPDNSTASPPGCRRAYDILVSTGHPLAPAGPDQAGIGNADSTPRTLPDGRVYDPESTDAQPFRDPPTPNVGAISTGGTSGTGGSGGSAATGIPTLPDLAFHDWASDLQPSIANALVPQSQATAAYWDPHNDPATWQHLVTHVVALDGAFDGDTTAPAEAAATRMATLRHTARNGRGRFAAPTTPAMLAADLTQVFGAIAEDRRTPAGPRVSALVSSTPSARSGAALFQVAFDDADWRGDITAFGLAAGAALPDPQGAWGTAPGTSPPAPLGTAALLDAAGFSPAARRVLSAADDSGSGMPIGIDWRWDQLAGWQRAALGTLDGRSDAQGADRLAYLRGDHALEARHGGPRRTRASRQGDSVNSTPWVQPGRPDAGHGDAGYRAFQRDFETRPAMLYVGANDGMLHAFAAASGQELLAYVPAGLHAGLAELARPGYRHRYYVDGSPLAGDLMVDGRWRTYLAGFLGAGGRGYFLLDVTDPARFATDPPERLMVMDKTVDATLDPDIGHIVAKPVMASDGTASAPQITRLNDGRWALVTGNGYNSPDARAVLLIQYLDGARELRKRVATPASTSGPPPDGNGLGAPRLVDLDGDRVPDVAYAGDLAGRLWKFPLGTAAAHRDDAWQGPSDATLLFEAAADDGGPQPITAAPVALPHPDGGLMLVFGTGRELTDADRRDSAVQSIYGIHDAAPAAHPAPTGAAPIRRSALVEQTVSAAPVGTATASGARLWSFSSNAVTFTGSDARRGWFVDLPEAGERVLRNARRFDGVLVDVASVVPHGHAGAVGDPCTADVRPARHFLNTLNGLDGSAPHTALYAYAPADTPSPATASPPATASRIEGGLRAGIRSVTHELGICPPGVACEDRARPGRVALRPSWRRLR